jgi:hypothetical protein
MTRSGLPTRITGRAYTVLAAMLLADGAFVRAADLAAGLFPQPTAPESIRGHIRCLRRFGVDTIQTDRTWGRLALSRGYRLVDLPPDEHLDSVLACVPAVRRSAWWTTRGSQTRMTA